MKMPTTATITRRRPAATPRARALDSRAAGVRVLCAPVFEGLPWLVHGFSTRLGGVSAAPDSRARRGELNLGERTWDSRDHVAENRRRFLAALPARNMDLVTLRQIHSDLIRAFQRGGGAHALEMLSGQRGDGMMTAEPGLLLSILSADCLPLLVADVRQRVVGAFHCGWRGTLRRIAQKGVGRMQMLFGSRPEDLRAALGPGIRACCYEVGEDVRNAFQSQFARGHEFFLSPPQRPRPFERRHALMFRNKVKFPLLEQPPRFQLDLVKANVQQLMAAGIAAENIWAEAPCTYCHPRQFFSYRRDAGRAGRMLSVIGIRGR